MPRSPEGVVFAPIEGHQQQDEEDSGYEPHREAQTTFQRFFNRIAVGTKEGS
jgi:hypothetical protein